MKTFKKLKKHYQKVILAGLAFILVLGFSFANLRGVQNPSAEIAIHSTSENKEGKVIAASCGAWEASQVLAFGNTWFNGVNVSSIAGHFIGDTVCGGGCPGGSVQVGNMPGTCQCPANTTSNGTSCIQNTCTNGATNYPDCNACPAGQYFTGSGCSIIPDCPAGTGWNGTSCGGCAAGQITSGNICTSCPAGQTSAADRLTCQSACLTPAVAYTGHTEIVSGIYTYTNGGRPTPTYTVAGSTGTTYCEWTRSSSNATNNGSSGEYYTSKTNWSSPAQAVKNYFYTENLQVRCGANPTVTASCPYTTASAQVAHQDWKKPCTSTANACGQTTTGTYGVDGVTCSATTPANPGSCTVSNACGQTQTGYACPAGCSANGQVLTASNNSCITGFTTDVTSVNPNGSVEFTWSLRPNVPGVNRKCGFYDISKGNVNDLSTAVAVPGLSELDPNTDRIRINNIQRNTNFCLICYFTKSADGTSLGAPAAIHQWVRVLRIGEN